MCSTQGKRNIFFLLQEGKQQQKEKKQEKKKLTEPGTKQTASF